MSRAATISKPKKSTNQNARSSKKVPTVRQSGIGRPLGTTHLSEKSTSRMSRKARELNEKILGYINNN